MTRREVGNVKDPSVPDHSVPSVHVEEASAFAPERTENFRGVGPGKVIGARIEAMTAKRMYRESDMGWLG